MSENFRLKSYNNNNATFLTIYSLNISGTIYGFHSHHSLKPFLKPIHSTISYICNYMMRKIAMESNTPYNFNEIFNFCFEKNLSLVGEVPETMAEYGPFYGNLCCFRFGHFVGEMWKVSIKVFENF